MRVNCTGFTLLELLVVTAILAILAALLFPVLSKSKQEAWQATCANNVRQLQMGWLMYSHDNSDILPHNSCGDDGKSVENPGWVAGTMWFNADVGQDISESINTDLLVGSEYAAGPVLQEWVEEWGKLPADAWDKADTPDGLFWNPAFRG